MQFDDRPAPAIRLEKARIARGFDTPKKATDYFGWSYDTYVQHESGIRGITRAAGKYAKAYRVSEGWLLTGDGEPSDGQIREVPIVGYVSAGSANFFGTGDGELDRVEAPGDATAHTVGVEIRGESLGSFFDRWIIFYDDVRSPITSDLIGKLCVVALPDDRVMVKRVRRARTPGFFHLESATQETIYDVEIVWAARVKNMVPQ